MKHGNTLLFLLALSFLMAGCRNETNVLSNNLNIVYQGRIDTSGQSAVFYWPGTSAKIYLKGRGSIYALLKDEKGKNYYNIILDNDSIRILHPDTAKRYYLLAANLPEGKHSAEIFKRTGWDKGNTRFYGFRLKGSLQLVSPPKAKRLKLEFYGNSITPLAMPWTMSRRTATPTVFTPTITTVMQPLPLVIFMPTTAVSVKAVSV